MPEQIKEFLNRIKEFWEKLDRRHKVWILSAFILVVATVAIVFFLLNRIQYEKLYKFEDTQTAKQAIEILSEEGIEYKLNDDNVTVSVNAKKKQDALLALTDSEIMSETEFSIQDLLNNDISTTSTDKILKNHLYMQSSLAAKIKKIDGVVDASVLYFPTDSGTGILKDEREISCSVMIDVNSQFDAENSPLSIATYVAYAIGNETTDKIKIIDQTGNLLFGGEEPSEEEAGLDKNITYKKTVEKWYQDKLFELAIKNGYSDAEIVTSLDINLDKTSILYTEYIAGENLEQGLYSTYQQISSENTGTSGDVPGSDSNDETDYYIKTGGSGNSAYEETNITYTPSTRVTETMKEWGVINNPNSSMAITLTNVVTRTEKELKTLGLLDGVKFEEYVLNNSDREAVEVPQELYQLFSDASGIPVANISITSYMQPNFVGNDTGAIDWTFYSELVIFILILSLLGFILFRTLRPEAVLEAEPELSVERLLATTKENQTLEDIEFSDKSETRRLIEKFVDENPESVANLMRNWLNDDGWD